MTKSKIILLAGTLAVYSRCMICTCEASDVEIINLRCEYLKNPLGIDVSQPRLSWVMESKQRGQKQTAYRLLVASSSKKLKDNIGDLWDSGKCKSDNSIHIAYGGKKLQPRIRCFWKVRVWDKDGEKSAWSKSAMWSTGLFMTSEPSKEMIAELKAKWIGAGPDSSFKENPWLRKSFEIADKPEDSFAYVASIGFHELFVNGMKVGENVLSPCISDLSKRVRYVTYDITQYLNKGTNTIAFWLGPGWSKWDHFKVKNKPLIMAEIDVKLPGGSSKQLLTDETWKIHPSSSSLLGPWKVGRFGGEIIDARKHISDWNTVEFDDSKWATASAYVQKLKLSAEKIEPNRKVTAIEPIGIEEMTTNVYRVDMGRNFTGWTEIALRGKPGKKVSLSFSERENMENVYEMRSECILDDRGKGVFRNRFNYSVGRWITINGLSHKPDLVDIKGYLVRNNYRRVGKFKCSNELLTQIYDTVLWTYESLIHSGYVVDCPHRERRGYGGDAHATMDMALNNYGMEAFFTKWIEDWRDVQKPNGDLPYTAPTYDGGGGPAWSGICVTLPWVMYERYADLRVLENTYSTMQRWIAFLDTKTGKNILAKWGGKWDFLGDWVPPGKDQGDDRVDEYSTLFFNNCYYLYNVQIVAGIAKLLGKPEEAKAYRKKADDIRKAIHKKFFNPKNNTYANGDQLYLALPLFVGVTPEELRQPVMKALENEILIAKKGHIDTGIHGTSFLLKMLTGIDRNDLIFQMASKTNYPGWGHMLNNGATTIWEQWDGENSRLHSSFLSIGSWFIEGVAGIQPDPLQPGYKHFVIKPGVVGDLTWASGELDSIHGKIVSDWKIENNKFIVNITVPANTTATVYVPAKKETDVTEGRLAASEAKGVKFLRLENERAVFAVGSGCYRFTSKQFERKAEQKGGLYGVQ